METTEKSPIHFGKVFKLYKSSAHVILWRENKNKYPSGFYNRNIRNLKNEIIGKSHALAISAFNKYLVIRFLYLLNKKSNL